MNIDYKTLQVTKVEDMILQVTLNRPEVRNAINIDMMQELLFLWGEIKTNKEGIRCIILTGSGDKAFCAGADLKVRNTLTLDEWRAQHDVLRRAMLAMYDCPIPIIAAVNGAAYGGGLELALASDFVYAADTAMFAQSEVKLGLIPGAMGTQNLSRAVGIRRAKELTFTGEAFTAKQALEWGVVSKICKVEYLLQETINTAIKISYNAPLAIVQAKHAINVSQHLELKLGYAFEVEAYHKVLMSTDREEGIKAFNEKRIPHFMGK